MEKPMLELEQGIAPEECHHSEAGSHWGDLKLGEPLCA